MQEWYEHTPRCSDALIPPCQVCGQPLFSTESKRIGLHAQCEREHPELGRRRQRYRGRGLRRRSGAST
jgi:hypothetical protein